MIIDPEQLSTRALYKFLTSAVVPRPIALVSSIDANGVRNAAPFSYFNIVTNEPPLLSVSIGPRRGDAKDTLTNIQTVGEFVINLVDESMFQGMVRTSGDWPPEVDEIELAGFHAIASDLVKAPRIAESPVQMECRLERVIELGASSLVIGRLLRAHVRDEIIHEGAVDAHRLQPVGRLGGEQYSLLREVARAARPVVGADGTEAREK
ncbi:MAG: flavin reductase family protein [Candidatus Eisenbacteria bacterium]|uniref:Flavin reductase family protein n=1 Tax=Eiseniibacteriota bacterium TaxID=2212470 RepID=A0A849SLM3_UNCEI|nr:flavin reductase family protein [Candidatus Eisenbacteria bacterium]